jgi:hypothetical protein
MAEKSFDAAGNFFAQDTKGLYNEIYTQLYDQLPQIVQSMREIQLIGTNDNGAKYRINKDETHGQQTYTITYHVYFGVDRDGLWKIYKY